MQTVLFRLGLVLFLLGLLTGFVVPALKNPRMALSSHLEAVLNGMFLVLLGLLWPHIHLPNNLGGYRGRAYRVLRLCELAGGVARSGMGRWAQTRADRGCGPRGLGRKGGVRQFSVGVPLAVDRGGRGHRHRRALTTTCLPITKSAPGR